MMKMPVLLAILMWSGIAAASDDAVVAELYGQKITAADLPLPPKMVEESRSTMSPDEFAQWRQDSLRQMLAYGVMQEAQKRFLTEMKLEPTDAEIDSYMESQRRFMAADRKRRAAEQEKLEQELGQADLSEERRSELQGNLTSLNWLAEQEKPPATDAERKEQREAERSVAAMMVATCAREWSIGSFRVSSIGRTEPCMSEVCRMLIVAVGFCSAAATVAIPRRTERLEAMTQKRRFVANIGGF